jgi:hypothetical protein
LTVGSIYVNLPSVPNYNAIITELQAEFDSLVQRKEQLNKQIVELAKAMEAIRVLAEESDEPTVEPPPLMMDSERGFTDRVRAILRANPAKALTAVVIRDAFLKDAPKDDPKILLIHTHNTLKRLHKQGEVEEVAMQDGRAYRWSFASRNALADRVNSLTARTSEREAALHAAVGRSKPNKAFYGEK